MAELPSDSEASDSARVPRVTEDKLAIGGRILEAREAKGLTQEDLASKVGVRAQAIWRYENGWNKPSADAAVRLAEVLGTTERYLMTGERAPPGIVDEEADAVGWQRFVELGLYDRYRELGLDEQQLEYIRHARFKAGPAVEPGPYVRLAELLLEKPVARSAEDALAEARARRKDRRKRSG